MQDAAAHDDGLRIEAITSNVPALVFQLQRHPDGRLNSLFTSKAVQAVCSEPGPASEIPWIPCVSNLHPDDRDSFFAAMLLSAQKQTHWNWEGRVIVLPRDVKWINLRAVPCPMPDGSTVWDGIILNITLTKRREDESQQAREILEKLSDHIQLAREEERAKISREIHDELGGILTTLKMDLGWLSKRTDDPVTLERAQTMLQLTRQALQTARRISADLRPDALDNLGLVAAMEEYANKVLGRLGIEYNFDAPDQEPVLEDRHATAIFRIYQESLTNVVRHAQASAVEVRIALEPGSLEIAISDNGIGIGIEPERPTHPQSYGILGMQERARQMGGKITITSARGKGTEVRLLVPLTETVTP